MEGGGKLRKASLKRGRDFPSLKATRAIPTRSFAKQHRGHLQDLKQEPEEMHGEAEEWRSELDADIREQMIRIEKSRVGKEPPKERKNEKGKRPAAADHKHNADRLMRATETLEKCFNADRLEATPLQVSASSACRNGSWKIKPW